MEISENYLFQGKSGTVAIERDNRWQRSLVRPIQAKVDRRFQVTAHDRIEHGAFRQVSR